jgi:hypothetical protein
MRYFVAVSFICPLEIENPQQYVEDAVAQMKGCLHPDDPEFQIDSRSVVAIDMNNVSADTTAIGVYRRLEGVRVGREDIKIRKED